MKSGSRAAGFTIVEVLIVLAVSMALFLAAVILVAGKQRQTEFGQGVRQVQTELQQSINEVSSGYYQSDGRMSCAPGIRSGSLAAIARAVPPASAPDRGTNKGCIFLGKALQFTATGSGNDNYEVYTIAGLRDPKQGAPAGASPLWPYGPQIVDFSTDVYDTVRIPYGITIQSLTYNDGAADTAIGALAIVSSVDNLGSSDVSGQVNIVAIPATATRNSVSAGQGNIDNNLDNGIINPKNGVKLCVLSGGTAQSAVYTIGGQGKNTTVAVKINDDGTCS